MKRMFLAAAITAGLLLSPIAVQAEIIATESARGTVAQQLVDDLGEHTQSSGAELFQYFMLTRSEFEKVLTQNGFKLGDVGMAYGVSYVTLWEVATGTTLPVSASAKVVKGWSDVFDDIDQRAIPASEVDVVYDTLLHTPIIFVALREAGKESPLGDLPGVLKVEAAKIFQQVTGYPVDAITIDRTGSIKPDREGLSNFLLEGDESIVRAFLERSAGAEKADKLLEARKGKGAGTRNDQDKVDQAILDTYTSIINTNTLMMFPNSW